MTDRELKRLLVREAFEDDIPHARADRIIRTADALHDEEPPKARAQHTYLEGLHQRALLERGKTRCNWSLALWMGIALLVLYVAGLVMVWFAWMGGV